MHDHRSPRRQPLNKPASHAGLALPTREAAELVGVSEPELLDLIERAGILRRDMQTGRFLTPAIAVADLLRVGALLNLRDGHLPALLPPGTEELALRDGALDPLDGWRRYAEATALLRDARGQVAAQEGELADLRRTLGRASRNQAGPVAGRLARARVELGRERTRAAALEHELAEARDAERRARARGVEVELLRAELAQVRERLARTEDRLTATAENEFQLRTERTELQARFRGLLRLRRTA